MHIGFIVSHYPSEPFNDDGGLGTSVYNLVTALQSKGHVTSVFVYGQEKSFTLERNGNNIYSIAQKTYKLLNWLRYRKYLSRVVNKAIKQRVIEVIEAPDWTGITAFMNISCPLVIRIHGTDGYFCALEKRPQKLKNRVLEKMALKQADHIVSVSKFAAEKTKDIFNLKKPVTVIHNGINTRDFSATRDVGSHGLSVLYFGSIIRKKGVLELPHIFNRINKVIPQCTFTIVGGDVKDVNTGTSTKELMLTVMTASTKANTTWLGRLPYEAVKAELQKATVVILPSYAEAFPMTWLEAMAMETALVTSDIGWAKELMVDTKTGYTVYPKNHREFADKVIRLLKDEALRKRVGKAARQHICNHFDIQHITQQNLEFYKRVSQ